MQEVELLALVTLASSLGGARWLEAAAAAEHTVVHNPPLGGHCPAALLLPPPLAPHTLAAEQTPPRPHCRVYSQDGGVPFKGQPQCRARGVKHPEVEQEAADGRNDQEGGYREALEAKGRHAVDGAQEQAKAVQLWRRVWGRACKGGVRNRGSGNGKNETRVS